MVLDRGVSRYLLDILFLIWTPTKSYFFNGMIMGWIQSGHPNFVKSCKVRHFRHPIWKFWLRPWRPCSRWLNDHQLWWISHNLEIDSEHGECSSFLKANRLGDELQQTLTWWTFNGCATTSPNLTLKRGRSEHGLCIIKVCLNSNWEHSILRLGFKVADDCGPTAVDCTRKTYIK